MRTEPSFSSFHYRSRPSIDTAVPGAACRNSFSRVISAASWRSRQHPRSRPPDRATAPRQRRRRCSRARPRPRRPLRAEIMKVRSNGMRALASATSASSVSRFDQVDLVEDQELFRPADAEPSLAIATVSSSRPRSASTSSATRSASPAPLQAAATMARSSRRRRRENAGRVDEDDLRLADDRDAAHRACASSAPCGLTIETLAPTSALTSVDLPTFGAPISATKPQRVAPRSLSRRQSSLAHHAFAREHDGRRRLLGGALRVARAFRVA